MKFPLSIACACLALCLALSCIGCSGPGSATAGANEAQAKPAPRYLVVLTTADGVTEYKSWRCYNFTPNDHCWVIDLSNEGEGQQLWISTQRGTLIGSTLGAQ